MSSTWFFFGFRFWRFWFCIWFSGCLLWSRFGFRGWCFWVLTHWSFDQLFWWWCLLKQWKVAACCIESTWSPSQSNPWCAIYNGNNFNFIFLFQYAPVNAIIWWKLFGWILWQIKILWFDWRLCKKKNTRLRIKNRIDNTNNVMAANQIELILFDETNVFELDLNGNVAFSHVFVLMERKKKHFIYRIKMMVNLCRELLTFGAIWSEPSKVTEALTFRQNGSMQVDTFSLCAAIFIFFALITVLAPWSIIFFITLATIGPIKAMSRACFTEFFSYNYIIYFLCCFCVRSFCVGVHKWLWWCNTYGFWYRYQHMTRIDIHSTIHRLDVRVAVYSLCT